MYQTTHQTVAIKQKIEHLHGYQYRTLQGMGLLLCALLSGCAGRGFTGFEVNQQPLVLADAALSQQISVQSQREGFGQPLQVGVQLRNQQDRPLTLEYRLYWYDTQGIELDHDPMPWLPITLGAHQVWSTSIKAQDLQATAYRLHVRPLRHAVSLAIVDTAHHE